MLLKLRCGRQHDVPRSFDYKDVPTDLCSVMSRYGSVLVSGVHSTSLLMDLARRLGEIYQHRDADETGVTRIDADVDRSLARGNRAYSTRGLLLHTDSSAAQVPPRFVLVQCQSPASSGGISLLADCLHLGTDLLERGLRSAYNALASEDACVLHSGADRYCGPVLNLGSHDGPWIRLRQDSLGCFSPRLIQEWPQIMEVLSTRTHSVLLESGDCYIMDNWRSLHGRLPYSGRRVVNRILVKECL